MATKATKRLPEVKILYDILPKGAEGGKEFARIVDLLLFHEARRKSKKITIFNDAAGDFNGLDSFEGDAFRREGTTGYQYKFYPSPLSAKHRKEIEDSLERTGAAQEQLKLKKWVLVTPQDLTESATRKTGGDVTWFEGLRKKTPLKFQVEHWGHRKLQGLFLETRPLSLFYYPELVVDGPGRRKTIQDIRSRYDENLIKLHRNIEFVGMSVYKPEATEGVPMENVYIPLQVLPEGVDDSEANATRINPLTFLAPGARHVVLGDPGSGKSTLLRFLALAGISRALQSRYKAKTDARLPVVVTLRRYADELRSRRNLPLIDYIQESIQGDFSLKDADLDFLEYYLETGQAILLFDGLDELPSPQFKQLVRDRISALITTYPGNTAIVTSRIVGYDRPFRFDESEFGHYRVTRLQLPEIEQFVRDWYVVRIENKRERDASVQDLIRILRDEDHVAIRELAENPLLLTIVALVHRIDAVLPDERVVLYQKCTETLLNTWHTWKFRERETEVKNRGKIERRNRRRMEAIAHWMQRQSGGTDADQRAVVPHADLLKFLATHIAEIERVRDPDEAVDFADDFLEFVKDRSGLLIEVGDQQYSFVHLTFQEYLTSTYIITNGETSGVAGIWDTIKHFYDDPRWHEVLRLMVAGLKAIESQEYLVNEFLSAGEKVEHVTCSRLLGGLLLDRIEEAENRQHEVLTQLLKSASLAPDVDQLRSLTSILRTWYAQGASNENALGSAFQSLWDASDNQKERAALALIATAMNWSEEMIVALIGSPPTDEIYDGDFHQLFFSHTSQAQILQSLPQGIESMWALQDALTLTSIGSNFVAAAFQALTPPLGPYITAKRTFEMQLLTLPLGLGYGPCLHHNMSIKNIIGDNPSTIAKFGGQALRQVVNRARERALDLGLALDRALDLDLDRALGPDLHLHRALALERALERALALALALARDRDLDLDPDRALAVASEEGDWRVILAAPDLYNRLLDVLCETFALEPRTQWLEALRVGFLPEVPQRLASFFDQALLEEAEKAFSENAADEAQNYYAGSQLLFDSWLYIFGFYQSRDETIFGDLVELTRGKDVPQLRIAHCIRDLAYGDESRADDLVSMVQSDDPEYRSIFETCLWS